MIIIGLIVMRNTKFGLPLQLGKTSHTYVYLAPVLSVEASGVCMLIENTEILFAVLYKSSQRIWSDTDITEFLRFRSKSILAGDMMQSTLFGIVKFQTPDLKFVQLFVSSNFEIPTPQCSMHYTPDGKGDVLDIIYQNFRL
jgi:hypothetical protein